MFNSIGTITNSYNFNFLVRFSRKLNVLQIRNRNHKLNSNLIELKQYSNIRNKFRWKPNYGNK